MRLEELVNSNYHKLNDNDLLIWQYIQSHKKQCCDISIEELADVCCISRTTISRFTQKLGFKGFREFKIHLKLEYDADQVQKDVLLDEVCGNYMKCISSIRDTDMEEICEHIFLARRLFAFGTGETQYAAVQMMKRMFMNVKRFFVTLYGRSELTMALEDMDEHDLVVIISLSGETETAVSAAKKLKTKGTYTISITRLSDNQVSRLCDRNLYINPSLLLNKGGVAFETCSSYFNVVELMCVKYMMYLKRKLEEL